MQKAFPTNIVHTLLNNLTMETPFPPPPKNNVEATQEVFGGGLKNFLGVAKLFFFNIVLGGAGGARSLDFHS